MDADIPPGDAFRGFMSSYFTGVTVLTALDDAAEPHGLTCNSLTSVSLAPPTLLVCLQQHSGTLAAIRDCGGFVVNLLHDHARSTAELFAAPTPHRFRRTAWEPSPRLGLPWLSAGTHAIAECRATTIHVVGDHTVVYGEVVGVTAVRDSPYGPLLYGRRTFFDAPGAPPRRGPTEDRKEDVALTQGWHHTAP
ncbi:flavin reductase family protein [Streptomyces sp. NPDC058773]|uniref:flavin reductase family protein n=1 Tax=Streptomyces sp. NPDC058773 TaxID=3346632 RepID=UPI00368435A3